MKGGTLAADQPLVRAWLFRLCPPRSQLVTAFSADRSVPLMHVGIHARCSGARGLKEALPGNSVPLLLRPLLAAEAYVRPS